jgi:hypothetical protein
MVSEEYPLFTQWKGACTSFDIGIRASINSLVAMLELASRALAQSEKDRYVYFTVLKNSS